MPGSTSGTTSGSTSGSASGSASESLSWERVRRAGATFTTPLLPDDYLTLVHPLWSSRELRGRVERIIPETEDAATLVIRPGWGWRYQHRPGQYVGIGVQLGGRWRWRSYSISSAPRRSGRTLAITVRAMPEGFLSSHLVGGLAPGTIVRLAVPAGDFTLPDPPPAKMLFLVGGSGITPVMSMLRAMDRRDRMADVVLHYSSTTPGRMIFRDELEDLHHRRPELAFFQRHTESEGYFALEDLDDLVPDWRERETWACGPAAMLDAIEQHFADAGRREALHTERFALVRGGDGGEGGTISFRNSGKEIAVDGATTVLEAGEQAGVGMPYGCRMGICHTCTLTLLDGTVRDLRSGEELSQPNEQVQTCISVPVGACTLNI